MPDESQGGPFKVWVFFPDQSHYCAADGLDMGQAVQTAKQQTETIGARLGISRRIIIEDAGGDTVFEWQYGKGVTFPRPQTSGETDKPDGEPAEKFPPT